MMDSSPLPPKRLRQQESALADTGDVLPSSPPDALGGGTTETQGVAAPPKKKLGRPRKAVAAADAEDVAEPAVKKKRAAPKKGKKAAKTPETVVDDSEEEVSTATKPATKPVTKKQQQQEQPPTPLVPLATALKHKVKAVNTFLDVHTSPLLVRETNDNVVIVNELDLLAALIILNVDYQLSPARADMSFEDASEMVVGWLDAGKVSVDFDRTCDMERAAQRKLAQSGAGLEDMNLMEVEIEMLLAHRKKLAEDGEPEAGFRVYEQL